MTQRTAFGDEELSAYIDGELDPARRLEIERLLETDTALAERIAAFASDKALLREIYAPLAERPVPPSWQARIESYETSRPASFSYRSLAAIAATLLLAVVCIGIAVRFAAVPQKSDIIAEAMAAQRGGVAPQSSLATSARDVASRSISQALAMRLKAPDLSRMGYRLAAVNIYAGARGNQPVELLYRNGRNEAFTLYLRRPVGPPRFDQFKEGRERVCIWQDDVLGTVMLGEMSAPEMQRLASLSYTGLTL
jgi:anti-sigma factor RsiW